MVVFSRWSGRLMETRVESGESKSPITPGTSCSHPAYTCSWKGSREVLPPSLAHAFCFSVRKAAACLSVSGSLDVISHHVLNCLLCIFTRLLGKQQFPGCCCLGPQLLSLKSSPTFTEGKRDPHLPVRVIICRNLV